MRDDRLRSEQWYGTRPRRYEHLEDELSRNYFTLVPHSNPLSSSLPEAAPRPPAPIMRPPNSNDAFQTHRNRIGNQPAVPPFQTHLNSSSLALGKPYAIPAAWAFAYVLFLVSLHQTTFHPQGIQITPLLLILAGWFGYPSAAEKHARTLWRWVPLLATVSAVVAGAYACRHLKHVPFTRLYEIFSGEGGW